MHLFQQFQFLEQIGTLAAIILKFSDFLIATDASLFKRVPLSLLCLEEGYQRFSLLLYPCK